jgi:rRNA maturation RNase YbeY
MVGLNRKYLKHRTPTDVLSFSLSGQRLRDGEKLEGEVYVNLDQARRQAGLFHESIRNEVARLVIHGILHLVGYDDASMRQKKAMTRLEDAYLGR